ncbi:agmatine deiminase [Lentilactobacillus otakiensis]|uniref:Putative agmatine deiminase n=1 Tax=Lentilactobacillus otakiensis DSM 19908 = JCM 15040 TaxID=1423780 RepID=S4NJT7_9LACO|nr:agmatine deiminase [Lentilactobacillus otakiensis]KRL10408.1 Agmatine deiminase [Lentilactobacillus otakiensis DSM 19908 = JCM 15040]MBZ3777077.1 agmatine deiminase [Lentilactobacillus otakiensis]MDV3518100.1 agmatine deiminase [Lentilactobacillus otakiensis]GAD16166.1 agmatine deiminase [Lentilactobacillus otakiensis DSM 19908 = JCM 15040]
MKTLQSSPKKDGYRMPGEFEHHKGVYILWPERPDNWRNGAKPAQHTFVNVAKAISQFEHVTVGVSDAQYANARHMLPDEVEVVEMSSDDSWIRDCGPTFVTNDDGDLRGVDWTFNAWGGLVDGLYFPWDKDDRVAQKVTELEHADRYRLDDFILEGGSIHVDGEGTLITTEECLLSEGRNSQLSKEQIENVLKEYLNLDKVIWLKRGIYLDETNGHVDNIANFVKPGVVALAWTDDKNDPQYEISKENYDILSNATDARGRKIQVEKLYVPKPVTITKEESEGVDAVDGTLPRKEGDRLAASYVNYYTANGGIVFPTFGDPNDAKAEETLQRLYPDRKIVGVPAREILLGGGNIHCITQQVPAGR